MSDTNAHEDLLPPVPPMTFRRYVMAKMGTAEPAWWYFPGDDLNRAMENLMNLMAEYVEKTLADRR